MTCLHSPLVFLAYESLRVSTLAPTAFCEMVKDLNATASRQDIENAFAICRLKGCKALQSNKAFVVRCGSWY